MPTACSFGGGDRRGKASGSPSDDHEIRRIHQAHLTRNSEAAPRLFRDRSPAVSLQERTCMCRRGRHQAMHWTNSVRALRLRVVRGGKSARGTRPVCRHGRPS